MMNPVYEVEYMNYEFYVLWLVLLLNVDIYDFKVVKILSSVVSVTWFRFMLDEISWIKLGLCSNLFFTFLIDD